QPEDEQQHRQQRELADERIGPEEQYEANGRNRAGEGRARQLQLQDQPDDPEHDQDEVDDRLAEELGDAVEQVVARDSDRMPIEIEAVVRIERLDAVDVGSADQASLASQV